MMVSPELFADQHKNKSYEELLQVRDELIEDIHSFEEDKDLNGDGWMIFPSPEVVYQCNLLYLGKLCELISHKYNQEC